MVILQTEFGVVPVLYNHFSKSISTFILPQLLYRIDFNLGFVSLLFPNCGNMYEENNSSAQKVQKVELNHFKGNRFSALQ